jgi:hypothetical protein
MWRACGATGDRECADCADEIDQKKKKRKKKMKERKTIMHKCAARVVGHIELLLIAPESSWCGDPGPSPYHRA